MVRNELFVDNIDWNVGMVKHIDQGFPSCVPRHTDVPLQIIRCAANLFRIFEKNFTNICNVKHHDKLVG